jgi:TonB family protein
MKKIFRRWPALASLMIIVAGGVVAQTKPALPAATPRVEPTASQLIQQGKGLYRAVRLKEALEKFEAALKLEADQLNPLSRDEALGLAAITAFRLDNQPLARDYFQQRADLPGQKESVRAFCYYRIALTHWREVHDLVARHGLLENGRLVTNLPEAERITVEQGISGGLTSIDLTVGLISDYAEAWNIRNLLYAEAAITEPGPEKAETLRRQSLEALTRAVELAEQAAAAGKKVDVADFGQPTIRVGEFSRHPEDDAALNDPAMKLIEGGRPLRRPLPVFPPVKTPKPDPAAGATVPPAPQSSTVKVEVLISTTGDVAFASLVDGRPEFGPSALLAARSWKFEPARLNGKPVQVSGLITFEVKPTKGR